MITHFEATVTLLGVVIGILATLAGTIWRARGYVDRLNTTDSRLADAIERLDRNQQEQHRENQDRFRQLESRLPPPPRRGRAGAAPGPAGR
jgi:hypothetical protein